jgi:hypothetical protein
VNRRCLGITRMFHRCGRYGQWIFYCEEHHRQPLQILFTLVFTVIAGIASIYSSGWFSVQKAPIRDLWVRVNDTSATTFDGDTTVMPGGNVRGSTSDPTASVFLLLRVARVCWHSIDCLDYPNGNHWNISEAHVDAQGNWYASPCRYPWTSFPQPSPDFEYWEATAVATNDPWAMRRGIVPQNCTIDEGTLTELPSLACSDISIALHGIPTDTSVSNPSLAPQPRRYCFGRELLKSWVRISDTSQARFTTRKEAADSSTIVELNGSVHGAVSSPQLSVFILFRQIRQCLASKGAMGVEKGMSIPTCEEPKISNLWTAREATVSASGDWSAAVDTSELFDDELPWAEFWQLQAVATFERRSVLNHVTPFGILAADHITDFAHVVCSDSRFIHRSEVFQGFWQGFEPTQVPGACQLRVLSRTVETYSVLRANTMFSLAVTGKPRTRLVRLRSLK